MAGTLGVRIEVGNHCHSTAAREQKDDRQHDEHDEKARQPKKDANTRFRSIHMALVESNLVSVQETAHRTYEALFLAVTDSKSDGAIVAGQTTSQNANSNIPDRHSYYDFGNEADLGSFAGYPRAKLKGDAQSNHKVWEVILEYTTTPTTADDITWDDPLGKPVDWSGKFAKFQKPLTHDRNGDLIVNAAGDVFVPPSMRDDSRPDLVAKKNLAALDLIVWADMADAVNSGLFMSLFNARTVKLEQFAWRRLFAGSSAAYYEVTYTFEVNLATFDFVVPNAGFNEIDANGDHVRISDDKLRDSVTPALLSVAGLQLTPAQVQGGAGNSITTRGYPERSFNVLDLGATIS